MPDKKQKQELTRAEKCFKMRVRAMWEENWKLFEEVLREDDWIPIDESETEDSIQESMAENYMARMEAYD